MTDNSIQQKRILIVDDDPNQQRLLQLFLRNSFQIESSGNIAQSLDILEGTTPVDIMLLDMTLAGDENGLELARRLRTTDRHQDLPIICLSGHDSDEYRSAALGAGCDQYLVKPVRKPHLLEEIARLLNP